MQLDKQPFLYFFLSLVSGIIVADLWGMHQNLLTILLVVLFLSVFSFRAKHTIFLKFRPVLLMLIFFLFGAYLHLFQSEKPSLPKMKEKEKLIFTIDKKLNSTEKNRRYIINFQKNGDTHKAVLSVSKHIQEFDFKHIYKADFIIQKPFSPTYDFQFDYSKYLARQHVYYQFYLPEKFQFADQKKISVGDRIKQHRFELLNKIENAGMSSPTKNFLKGIILADRTELGQIAVQDFNRSGLMHFLAISGTHIVIIFWMLMLIFRRLFPLKLQMLAIILSLVFIWFFALYIGFGNSVLRSCVMINVYYVYVLLQRKTDLLHALSLAGIIILFMDTQQIFDIGFQLSFLAVFGIFWLNEPILKYFPFPKNLFQEILQNTFSMSVSAQLITIPVVLYYFHQFSWMSVPANLLIVPLSEIVIISSFVMTLFFGVNFSFDFVLGIYDLMVHILLKGIHWFADQDFAFTKNIPMSLGEVVCCFAMFYFLRFLIVKVNIRNVFIFVSMLAVFFTIRLVLTNLQNSRSEILVVKYFKSEIVIRKNKEDIVFYFQKGLNKKDLTKNIIDPYLSSRRQKEYKLQPMNNSSVQFDGKTIFFRDEN